MSKVKKYTHPKVKNKVVREKEQFTGVCVIAECHDPGEIGWNPMNTGVGGLICRKHWHRHCDDNDPWTLYEAFGLPVPQLVMGAPVPIEQQAKATDDLPTDADEYDLDEETGELKPVYKKKVAAPAPAPAKPKPQVPVKGKRVDRTNDDIAASLLGL